MTQTYTRFTMTDIDDILALIDPWTALADGRMQLLAAIDAASVHGPDLAETLGIAADRDRAMCNVMRAYIEGARDFSTIATTGHHVDAGDAADPIALAEDARRDLLEALAVLGTTLDDVVEIPWNGRDSWRIHLVTLAMHDGADAQRLMQDPQ